ncbi:Carboxylic ester hydrolase [Aphelenchoides besseyi]|nr:Carboxylic ester hydrolase [Aphelenchoides besseyi]KAI6202214.1 Carboxylic ester hydrolase [Aphelenchoides besseyi]
MDLPDDNQIHRNPDMKTLTILSSLFLLQVVSLVAADGPILKTNVGEFEGKVLDFGELGTVDAFFGVTYAKAPIAERRFEKPTDAEYVKRRSATVPKAACPQPDHFPNITYDEDCLHMDVFKPTAPSPDGKGYPVLFFIHGGGFLGGSAHLHSTDFFVKSIVSNGIVLVNIQYRLNILGFASTGPEAFNGNYGLWDQRKALLFVRRNAKEFDIDVKRITAGGYSAGSASVGMLSISEQTRDLFSQAIQMSGSPFGEWATSNKAVILTEKIATALECNGQSSVEVKRCLKKKSYEELNDAFHSNIDKNDFNLGQFSPRLDAEFFSTDFPELISSAPPKPSLFTITENEGAMFTLYDPMSFFNEHVLTDEQKAKFGAKDFKAFVKTKLATEAVFGNKASEVQKKIIKFYLDTDRKTDRLFYLEMYSKLISDILFVVPQLLEVRHKTTAGWPIYMLKNTHFIPTLSFGGNRKLPTGIPQQTTHGYEYGVLFELPVYSRELTAEDKKFQKNLLDSIVNFVKNKFVCLETTKFHCFRTPKTDEQPEFQVVDSDHPLVYSEVSDKVEAKNALFPEELRFWDQMTKSYDFDLIRGIDRRTRRSRTEL